MTEQRDDAALQLAEARRTIEQQQEELRRLRSAQADNPFAAHLRTLLEITAAANVIAAPTSDREELQAILETAADVLDAQAAALCLVDEERDELWFEVALGGKAEEVARFRLPLGEGIAGYVAATGQPIAVSDVERDPRFAADIAHKVGYLPKAILCVPMVLNERVVGVLEMLDRADGKPFSTRDMEMLGRFARLAALTVEESHLTHDVRHLFRSLLADLARDAAVADATRRFADRAAEYVSADTLRLASLVHEICQHGSESRRLVVEVLTSLSRHLAATAVNAGSRV